MSKLSGLLKVFGGILLIAAFVLCIFNLLDAGRAGADADEISRSLTAQINTVQQVNAPDGTDNAVGFGVEPPTVSIDNASYIGVLELPDLGLTLPVASEWSYPQLQVSPCRFSGSPNGDHFVICAHNYSTHFGGISGLNVGAEAVFTDLDGRRFCYRLKEQEIVEPDDGAHMTDSGYALTLFTCNWNGSARVTLRFDRADRLS